MLVKQYNNPIIRGMRPDPSIVRVGKFYYMVNSTFEYYPGITLARSTDLLN
jgi:Beta-xylosidase